MKKNFGTNEVVENLAATLCGEGATLQQRHLVRESLYALVRLAKSEQVKEMRMSVKKLTAHVTPPTARRRAKEILLAHRLNSMSLPKQQRFEFYEN